MLIRICMMERVETAMARHEAFMDLAIRAAHVAARRGEVPVGAVLAGADGRVLAGGRNRTIGDSDPTAHAEIVAIRRAGRRLGNYRLLNTILYVTVEPCLMCMGAIIHARIEAVIHGAPDPRWGGAGSLYDFSTDPRLNHPVRVIGGIREERCRELMRSFFRARRRMGND